MNDIKTLVSRSVVIVLATLLLLVPALATADETRYEQCATSAEVLATSSVTGEVDYTIYQILLDSCLNQ